MSAKPKRREQFRPFTDKQRGKAADTGHALPDGSFPIFNVEDLNNAKQAVGRAKDPAAAKAHINKWAKKLNQPALGETAAAIVGGTNSGRAQFASNVVEIRSAARLTFHAALDVAAEPELVTLDGVEYVKGKPLHIFPFGTWVAVDGRHVVFDEQDGKLLVDDLKTRNSFVALTYDHEQDRKRGSLSAGWMDPKGFEMRPDGLWANGVYFTKPAYFGDNPTDPAKPGGIKGGEWKYISGDALGIGDANPGTPFHPRRLLAAALVPKPGFVRGLQGITLSANESAALDAWLKETTMSKSSTKSMLFAGWKSRQEFLDAMKLGADATDDMAVDAFKKWLDEEAAEPEHKASLAKKFGTLDDGTVLDHSKADCKDPNCQHFDGHSKGECPDPSECDEDGHDEADDDEGDEKMSAKILKKVNEKFAALAADIATKATDEAKRNADTVVKTQVEARFAADAKAKEVEDSISAALKDGRLKGDADAKIYREAFAANHELGKQLLGALVKPAFAPGDPIAARNAMIVGGVEGQKWSREMMFKSNGLPDYDAQGAFLSQVMRFSAAKGLSIPEATAKVMKGENSEFESLLAEAKRAGGTAEHFTKAEFGAFRSSLRPVEYDIERAKFARARVLDGDVKNLPGALMETIQRFAGIADFQPAARTTIPMGLGYMQADFVGDDALPVFVGGADEAYAWPEYSFEKFAALAEKAGIVGGPVWSSLNIVWHRGTLDKYPVGTKVDRRLRAASVTLPEGIDTTVLTNLKSQVGTSREVAQHTFLATNGNYFDSTYYPTISPQWSAADSPASYAGLPINDVTKGVAHVRVAVRTAPDLLILSYNAALSMRKNQQVIDTVRYTGTMERPGTMVSNATLAALFAGMFNLRIVVAEAGSASLPSGLPVSDVWGNDAWLVCTGQGQVIAPRFGITAVAAGSPKVRAFPEELLGADGTDSVVVTDSWSIAAVNNKAAYWMKSASAAL